MDYVPSRMMIRLDPPVVRELAELAEQERRDPREQAALMIQRQLEWKRIRDGLDALELAVLVQVAKDEGLDSVEEAMGLVLDQWVEYRRAEVGA